MLIGESSIHHQDIRDDQQVSARGQDQRLAPALSRDLARLRRPGHASGQPLAARLNLVEECVARGEGVLAVDQIEFVRIRLAGNVGQLIDFQPRFLGQIASEEIGFRELAGGQDLALKVIDALVLGAHHDSVRPSGVADLSRNHHAEGTAEHGQHVDGGGRGRQFAAVEGAPALLLTEGQFHEEAALLGEDGVRIRPQTRRWPGSSPRSPRTR